MSSRFFDQSDSGDSMWDQVNRANGNIPIVKRSSINATPKRSDYSDELDRPIRKSPQRKTPAKTIGSILVKGFTRRSKTGKATTVKTHTRKVKRNVVRKRK